MSRHADNHASSHHNATSLQSAVDLNALTDKDDPRKIYDRKEKKKIQNRLAQRTYRYRMKARLDQLEARLESREPRSNDKTEIIDACSTSIGSDPSLEHIDGTLLSTITTTPHLLSENDHNPARHMVPMNVHDHNNTEEISSLYFQSDGLIQNSHTLVKEGVNTHVAKGNSHKSPQEMLLDILSSQTQLISRLNQFCQETKGDLNGDRALGCAVVQPGMGQVDLPFNGVTPPSLNDHTSFAFTAQKTPELWNQDTLISQMIEPAVRGEYATPPLSISHSDLIESMIDTETRVSMDKRLQLLIEHMAKLGFDHFDWAAGEYYNHTFDESSSMANEQRMSRNRRLPALLARIFSATVDWSEWERRGFYEEVVKITESLLVSEASASHSRLAGNLSPLVDLYIKEQVPSTTNSTMIRREIENNLPSLWVLVMALTSKNSGLKPNDRSKTAIATILLLIYSGRMPKHELLDILSRFLV